MLKTITDSYKMFLRYFPVIFLYVLPLLAVTSLQVFFEGFEAPGRGVIYFLALATFLMPLISAATDIAVYKKLLGFASVNPFNNFKTLVIYIAVQLALGLIAVLPIYLVNWILIKHGVSPLPAMMVALAVNMFFGVYFLARFNILLPLIVQERVPGLKDFVTYTDFSYKSWMLAAFLVYLPYIIINYMFRCPYLHEGLTNLYMLVFVCFNTAYVLNNRLPTAPSAATLSVKNEARKTEKRFSPVETEPEPRPQPEKSPEPEDKPKPKKKAPVKKPAPKKTAKPVKPSFEPA